MALAARNASQSVASMTRVALPVHAVIACNAACAEAHHLEAIVVQHISLERPQEQAVGSVACA